MASTYYKWDETRTALQGSAKQHVYLHTLLPAGDHHYLGRGRPQAVFTDCKLTENIIQCNSIISFHPQINQIGPIVPDRIRRRWSPAPSSRSSRGGSPRTWCISRCSTRAAWGGWARCGGSRCRGPLRRRCRGRGLGVKKGVGIATVRQTMIRNNITN
jgi:hypothetical protein